MYNNVLSVDNTGIFFGDRKAIFILSNKKKECMEVCISICDCKMHEEWRGGPGAGPDPLSQWQTNYTPPPPPIPQINYIRTPFVMLTYSLFQFKNERFLRYSVVRYPDLPPGVLHWCTEDCLLSVNWCVHVSAHIGWYILLYILQVWGWSLIRSTSGSLAFMPARTRCFMQARTNQRESVQFAAFFPVS